MHWNELDMNMSHNFSLSIYIMCCKCAVTLSGWCHDLWAELCASVLFAVFSPTTTQNELDAWGLILCLFCQAMEETIKKDGQKFRFLIDGFPRNADNLEGWNKEMDGKADVKFVLFFDCTNEVRHANQPPLWLWHTALLARSCAMFVICTAVVHRSAFRDV